MYDYDFYISASIPKLYIQASKLRWIGHNTVEFGKDFIDQIISTSQVFKTKPMLNVEY